MTAASTSYSGAEWRGGLVDDTMGPVDALSEATIRKELAEIAKFRTNRNKGYHWVTHQLKVLVSDEEEDADWGNEDSEGQDGGATWAYDSDDSADMERCAIELSLQGVESQARSSTPRTTGHVTSEREVSQCPRCKKYPRFSQRRRTRQFRLVEPWEYLNSGDEYEACDHFVAVSYCWSSFENGSRTCQIRDCTRSRKDFSRTQSGPKGKSRDDNLYLSPENGRVPFDEVLDRAVEFASSEGLRCIWIDQACLPQDESEEHQTGVQSMDMVYKRARHTIGLLGCPIGSQDELDSLATFFAWGRSYATSGRIPGQDWWNLHFFRQGANGMMWGLMSDGMPKAAQTAVAKQVCQAMVDLLQRIIDDKWYTRAWILQESISAGPKLSLLLRVPPGLEYNPSPFMEQDGRLMTTDRQHNSTFILTWGEFDNLRSGLLRMIEEFYDFNMSNASDMGHGGDNGVVSRILDITSPERIPRPHPKHQRRGIIESSWNSGFVCNAACAIGLLAGRHCLKAEDKTAIVANLCNFEIRLDTFQLAKHFRSLRLCLITLALLNADLSLLIPELFDTAPSINDMAPLLQAPYMNLHKVNKHGVESDDVPRFQAVSQPCLTPGGMMLPAFLWCVDREIDFAPIHFKWAERWWAMKCLRQSNRSVLRTWWQNGRNLTEPLRQEADRILNNIRRGYLEGESLRQHKDDAYPNVLFSASVPFTLLQRNSQARFMIGEMVRDILSYLLHSGEKYLANSIWQSLRSPRHETDEGHLGAILPDEINDLLLKRVRFEELLQLNHTPDAAFAQEWLFDRVVLKGKLWVGHYIPSRTKGSGFSSMQPFSIISNDIHGDSHRVYRHSAPPPDAPSSHSSAHTLSIVQKTIRNQGPMITEMLNPWATRPMSLKDSSVLGRDIVKAALYEELRYQWRSPGSFQQLNSATIPGIATLGLSPSQEAFFHYMETYVGWDIDEQESRVHRRMSAFDVDGPCKVATPVDGTRERIPHSEERTLSSCWVVEAKGTEVPDEEADWIRKEFVRFRRVVLGGSPLPTEPPTFSELELQHVPEHLIENVSALRLKVLRQVHGVWDIIDPAPFQSYLFS